MKKLLIGCCIAFSGLVQAEAPKTIELSDLIAIFMPGPSGVAWSTGSEDKRITWKTSGVRQVDVSPKEVRSSRNGVAVVTMNGKALKELKVRMEPVKWEVGLHSAMPSKFGPEAVTINANASLESGPPADYLAKQGYQLQALCVQKENAINFVRWFKIEKGGKTAYLEEQTSGGSGGVWEWITLHFTQPSDMCRTPQK